MNSEFEKLKVIDLINITDYVANGSFASLKANVNYKKEKGYAILIRLVDYNSKWLNDFVYVDKQSYDFLGKSSVKPGDVIISNVGANAGTVFRAPDLGIPMTLGPNSILLKPRTEEDNVMDYIYYYFTSPEGQHLLKSILSGSAQPKFNKTDLRKSYIRIPKNRDFDRYSSPLLKLDQKIKSNININEILEEIPRIIFKSWFVNFDPIRAKVEAKKKGEDPQLAAMKMISGKTKQELQLLSEENYQSIVVITNLFPDEFEETAYGKIPKGWGFSKLSNVVSFLSRGMTPKYIDNEEEVMVINQRCIRNHTIDFSNARFHNEEFKAVKSKEVFVGDVLINSTGVGTLGRIAVIKRLIQKTTVDTHVTIVRADSQKINPTYLGQCLLYNESIIEEMGEGSTGQTELKRSVVGDLVLCRPDFEIQKLFAETINPMMASIDNTELENEQLSSIRNVLLPKLLKGDLNISE